MLRSREIVSRILFREPDGLRKGLLNAGLSVACVILWVSLGFVGSNDWSSPSSPSLLFFSLTLGVVAIAESLPPSRQWSVGILRIVAITIPITMLIHLILFPESHVS
ncbi:MAG: hypothetical protein J07HQX50_01786 [Haloquadratum sp. J07HQX50]|nr:MAG: hypothetical protein J07HQX50_01786 [Haloquadratum sp. J07HQX50]